jgi:hypothetical protein
MNATTIEDVLRTIKARSDWKGLSYKTRITVSEYEQLKSLAKGKLINSFSVDGYQVTLSRPLRNLSRDIIFTKIKDNEEGI